MNDCFKSKVIGLVALALGPVVMQAQSLPAGLQNPLIVMKDIFY